jgi:hypothetical protein
MAPYLLFGFLIAGVLHVLVSPSWVERHLGGRGLGPVVKASIFGVPLPLCSCGVIPVTASIRRHGASKGATASFLLSTPSTGVDSILATYALLGPVFAVFRPVVAFVTGVLGGLLISVTSRETDVEDLEQPAQDRLDDQCSTGDADCGTCEPVEKTPGNPVARALHYGFVTLPRDLAKALIVGILIAGIIGALVERNVFEAFLGGGILSMFIMMAVGIPIYVCATASIPIAVGFMHLGASPGAALVFLTAGPATNAAAIAVLWRVLGRSSAIVYLAAVAVSALAAGFALDLVYDWFTATGYNLDEHMHHETIPWWGHALAVVLIAVLAWSVLSRRFQGPGPEEAGAGQADTDTVVLEVSGMSCSHCADAVTRALNETAQSGEAHVDLDAGRAVVSGRRLQADRLVKAVESLGYDASVSSH